MNSRFFVIWNLLGILDLVVAVGVGVIGSMWAWGAAGEVTSGPKLSRDLSKRDSDQVVFGYPCHC